MAACKLGRFEREKEMAACKFDCLKIWNLEMVLFVNLEGLEGCMLPNLDLEL